MWPDEPFAEGRGSFLRPVLPPPFDPDATPVQTVHINCSWLPYIRGALQQLLLQATWDTDDPAVLQLAQSRAFNLINLFSECDSLTLPYSCDFDIEGTADGLPWTCLDRTPDPTGCFSTFVPGSGFVSVLESFSSGEKWTRAECVLLFPPQHVTFVTVSYDLLKGSFYEPTTVKNGIVGLLAGSLVFFEGPNIETDPDGSGKSVAWAGDAVVDELHLMISPGVSDDGSDPGGTAIIRASRVDGYAETSLCGSE